MGLFTGLLTLPLAPVRGVVWVADQLVAEAERELYDESRIRAQLIELELAAETGDLSETEIRLREDALLERLAVSQAHRAQAAEGWRPNHPEGSESDG